VVAPGDTTAVTGTGFPPGQPLLVQLFSDPVTLATTTADAAGAFRVVVTIPVGTPAGVHALVVSGPGGLPRAQTALTVTAPPGLLGLVSQVLTQILGPLSVGVVTPVVGTVPLARTGSDAARSARLALLLVGFGSLLVGLAWRSPAGTGGFGPPRRRRRRRSDRY
jgi:hypothetical protein